jgi:hypothetical protein
VASSSTTRTRIIDPALLTFRRALLQGLIDHLGDECTSSLSHLCGRRRLFPFLSFFVLSPRLNERSAPACHQD